MPNLPRKPRRPRRTRRPNPLRDAQRHMRQIRDTFIDHGVDLMDQFVGQLFDRILGPNTPPPPGAGPSPHPRQTPRPGPRQAHQTTLYDVLEVSPAASPETITAAWKSLSKRFHPDLATGDAEKMKVINSAYEILSDPQKRKMYDRLLRSNQ